MPSSSSALEARLDFLTFTRVFPAGSAIADIDSLISDLCGFTSGAERWGYLDDSRGTFKSVGGLLGRIRPLDRGGYHLRIEMPGQFCRVADLISLCRFLADDQFRITRLDIALDDYDRRVDFSSGRRAGDSGNYRLLDSFKSIQSVIMPGFPSIGTAYFGKSDKIVRFYDAEFVHSIPADRWELQLRDDHARSAFSLFCSDPDCLPSLVVTSIDFGIRADQHRDFDRFPWWQSLIDDAGSARKIEPAEYSPDLGRAIAWLDRSVAPTLAVLRAGLGDRFEVLLSALSDSGYSRLKGYHHEWIETIRDHDVDPFELLKFSA